MTSGHQAPQPPSGRAGTELAADRAIARAEEDYRRLRAAYLALAQQERNDVALAMVGADMDRAHEALQSLTGLRQLPVTHESSRVLRRQVHRHAEEHS